jgi:hypothetical protein
LTDVKTLTGLAAALALLLVPSTGLAQLPTGEADGVRVVRERGAVVVIFTARAGKLYKRIAGEEVVVSCTEVLEAGTTTGEVKLRAPKRRGKLVTGDRTRGMDYCRVWRAPHTVIRNGKRRRFPRRLLVSVPLTQRGAVFLDEQSKTIELVGVLVLVELATEEQNLPGAPTYAQLIEEAPKAADEIVALANPADGPPAGRVGYYSDGQEHVAVSILSASGRRLFIETAADDVLTTNVSRYVFGDLE